jgi:hypothetical protein
MKRDDMAAHENAWETSVKSNEDTGVTLFDVSLGNYIQLRDYWVAKATNNKVGL